MNILKEQYNLVIESRSFVLSYCAEIPQDKLQERPAEFKKNSIIMLLVHTINTYVHWIGNYGLKKDMEYFEDKNEYTIDEIRQMYTVVDSLMAEFLEKYSGDFSEVIKGYNEFSKKDLAYPAYQVYTHALTHEFHHKGQLMSVSSLLGFTPPDADIIRF
jgi:uncharacterized damage-inducible protein DinB